MIIIDFSFGISLLALIYEICKIKSDEKKNYFIASMCSQNHGKCIYEKPRNIFMKTLFQKMELIEEKSFHTRHLDKQNVLFYEAYASFITICDSKGNMVY